MGIGSLNCRMDMCSRIRGGYVRFFGSLFDLTVVQNLGIVISFGMAFFVALLIFSEFNISSANVVPVVLFKRGSTPTTIKSSRSPDEETLKDKEKQLIITNLRKGPQRSQFLTLTKPMFSLGNISVPQSHYLVVKSGSCFLIYLDT
jgi:hypothetical protein